MADARGLRLHDIYSLKLRADLVVLSACSAGARQAQAGEGLIGLTRGMMYAAGATRVVASLWKVDHAPTAELRGLFYQALTDGHPRQMAVQCSWSSPYYWAASNNAGRAF